jgi:membrane fusion protein, multidrug efflux system
VSPPRFAAVPAVVVGGVALLIATGALMVHRAEARINKVALTSSAQPVAVVRATAAMYRPSRNYAGTFESWVESGAGPQFLSAYVDTVLVRPGAVVKRGDLLATLDCRNANTTTRAVAMQARAIAAEQKAVADEATRTQSMLDGGFVSPDEAEQIAARSAEQEARFAAQKATLAQATLSVNDCLLHAPFDGEIATRTHDPGAFVRPGTAIVTVVDRSTVRLVADAPETDFEFLKPGTEVRVRVYATGQDVMGTIARRAPSTDPETRTVHFEVDVPDSDRQIPANTTGEVHVDAGKAVPATEVPLYAASVRGEKAVLVIVEGDRVHPKTFDVKGEIGGSLFVSTALTPGTTIVLEGRELLEDGDRVAVSESLASSPAHQGTQGGGATP